ncbi:MAG: hypothetical protein A2148_01895 [Chloroflexi bacterium RBG_16_68_14]|nr:MAG: hypothetical protein A2148_01895 [Chloroflexi bacterium RBG_16_68_14]
MERSIRSIARLLPVGLAAALLAAAASGGGAGPVGAAPSASVRLEPLASRVDYSDGAFFVRIELSGLDHHGTVAYDDDRDTVPDRYEPSEGLGAYEVLLYFDPNVVDVTDAEAGDIFQGSGRSAQCLERTPERGQLAVGCVTTGSAAGPQGSGALATITLAPLANGVSYLVLEAQLSGPLADSIPLTAAGGIVEVAGAPQTAPTPVPDDAGDDDGGDSSDSNDRPSVIGGGEPGVVDAPDGAASEGGPARGPSAGTGYQPPGATLPPLVLGSALAFAGTALLLLGSRLAARGRRR